MAARSLPPSFMVLWIGVDDTDSLRGMCTTFLATEFVRELTKDLDLIGYPRLVRLNPNIPWKTRGNGAIAMAMGRGRGKAFRIGEIHGREVEAYPDGVPDGEPSAILERLSQLVERWSDLGAEGTDPGLVVLRRKPTPSLYWRGVREIVPKSQAVAAVRGLGFTRTWKEGRGIVGAAAACAWRPRDRTWEVLAYRDRSRWGSRRKIDAASVRDMDRRVPSTFNNYDYANERVVIAPRTPCPVLFGVRGDRADDLPRALRMVHGEAAERWLVFLTNQGTDDHIGRKRVPRSLEGGRFRGRISKAPTTLRGGHVVFGVGDWEATIYEPAKQFRETARNLLLGDTVEVIGSVRAHPRTLNVEKLHVVRLVRSFRKVANPICTRCGHRTKSMGSAAPFRCPRCGRLAARSRAEYREVPRAIERNWYEPPTGSRRHLSKPLKRGMPL